ncbi:hypothetical protein BJ170DRAFT_286252 [Xylariales sp. AK1849]|nr:hypothetical protein BJ170DRAFT_286252 [Xylariales sp. AK1849]
MTPQLNISVNGTGSVFRKAERGVLYISVSSTHDSQAQASQDVQQTSEQLSKKFRSYALKTETGYPHPSAIVTAFSSSALRSSSYMPGDWNGKRKVYERQYTATTSHEVVFRDLAMLAETANGLSSMPHVTVDRTEWRLTDSTRAEIERDARKKAIANAVQKAEDYAGVVGRNIVAVDIKDGQASFLSAPLHFRQPMMQMQMQQQAQMQQQQQQQAPGAAISSEGPAVEPQTVTATAQVNVQFCSVDDGRMEE